MTTQPQNGQALPDTPEKPRVGRPLANPDFPHGYTPEKGAKVCELVAEGSNLKKIAEDRENGLPCRSVLYRWLEDVGVFRDNYARARVARADWRADKIDDILEKVETGVLEPNVGRTLFDGHKWQAGKENGSRYGDKQVIEGNPDKPVEHIHRTDDDNLAAAKRIALALEMGANARVIEGESEPVCSPQFAGDEAKALENKGE